MITIFFLAGAFLGFLLGFSICAGLTISTRSRLEDEVALLRERCEANDELIRQAELVFRVTERAGAQA